MTDRDQQDYMLMSRLLMFLKPYEIRRMSSLGELM